MLKIKKKDLEVEICFSKDLFLSILIHIDGFLMIGECLLFEKFHEKLI